MTIVIPQMLLHIMWAILWVNSLIFLLLIVGVWIYTLSHPEARTSEEFTIKGCFYFLLPWFFISLFSITQGALVYGYMYLNGWLK